MPKTRLKKFRQITSKPASLALINCQTYKSFNLGGLGPNVNSDEYKRALHRKKLMVFFANQIKKMNDSRYRKHRSQNSRNPTSVILTNNGKTCLKIYLKRIKAPLKCHLILLYR